MSASALDQAFESMEEALPPGLPLAFHLADMLSFLKQTTATYDIVLAAFSLHHLTPDEKRQVEIRAKILSEESLTTYLFFSIIKSVLRIRGYAV